MECRYQKHIWQWVDGEIEENQKAHFKDHLSQCVTCRETLQSCLDFKQALQGMWPPLEPSKNFEAIFWEKIQARQEQTPTFGSWLKRLDSFIPTLNLPQAFAVLLIALMIGSFGGALTHPKTPQASTLSLSGFGEFQGLPSTSVAAAYLKSTTQEEFKS